MQQHGLWQLLRLEWQWYARHARLPHELRGASQPVWLSTGQLWLTILQLRRLGKLLRHSWLHLYTLLCVCARVCVCVCARIHRTILSCFTLCSHRPLLYPLCHPFLGNTQVGMSCFLSTFGIPSVLPSKAIKAAKGLAPTSGRASVDGHSVEVAIVAGADAMETAKLLRKLVPRLPERSMELAAKLQRAAVFRKN